jgi:hypothetical protein
MKSKLAPVAFFCLSLPLVNTAAIGQEMPVTTGNQIAEICAGEDLAMRGYCIGYVVGLIEGMKWGLAFPLLQDGKSPDEVNKMAEVLLRFCFPEGATNRQSVDVVTGYLSRHPETRHFSARLLAQLAFIEAFPCEE